MADVIYERGLTILHFGNYQYINSSFSVPLCSSLVEQKISGVRPAMGKL
jgi:hypothetical protein